MDTNNLTTKNPALMTCYDIDNPSAMSFPLII